MNSLFPRIDFCRWDYIAILICSIPAFFLLGTPAIYIWDEAVYANSSLDMSQGHSWWVPLQDAYNTKPPLVLWMQATFLKILPWPEWAVRLPSALSVTGILVMMTLALKRWGFSQYSRIVVLISFVANEGFIRHHISRTGDLDAVMTFFVVGYSLIVLDAIYFNRWSKRHMLWFFVMIVCAFYSKSIAGWMMLGPLGIVWLLSPIRKILWTRSFILGSILSLGVCLFYYLTRQMIQPGYMDLTWKSEYLRMFKNVMPWHEHGFGYYFKNFVNLHTYFPWIFLVSGTIAYALYFLKDKPLREHTIRWIILSLGYLLLISIPAVKLEWYDAPVYPFFAMILGTVFGHLSSKIPIRWTLWLIPLSLLLMGKMIFIIMDTHPRHPFENEGAILRQMPETDSIKVFMPVETQEHRLQLDFYRKFKSKKTGSEIRVLDNVNEISIQDRIIISQDNLKKIQESFLTDTLKTWPGLGYEVKIKGVK